MSPMSSVTVYALVALLGGQGTPATSALERGVAQYGEGLLSEAVTSLDEALGQLSSDAARNRDRVRAWVFKGAALVGLLQEDPAKQAFLEAVHADPTLRLRKGEFPDRVVRVFEAARTGQRKSVLERPNTAPKKAGIGAVGIAAIVAGGVALASGAVVATRPDDQPTPAPTPTPAVDTTVEIAATDVPRPIISSGSAISSLVIPTTGTVADLAVTVVVTHADPGRLWLELRGPTGTTNRFYDGSVPTFTGSRTFTPADTAGLQPFVGPPSAGQWTLFVTYPVSGVGPIQQGTLQSWRLRVRARP